MTLIESQELFKRILLIEDTPAHLMLIQRALRGFAESIVAASTVSEAEELLSRDATVDLVITDLHLPDQPVSHFSASESTESSITVQRLIQACGARPLLVLTSSTSLKEAIAALRSGARDYIVKNFNHEFADIMALTLQRIAAESKLIRQKQLAELKIKALSYAIEHSEDGFALVNHDGSYIFTNDAFINFTALSGGEAQSLIDLIGPKIEDSSRLREALKERLESINSAGAVWQVELQISDTGRNSHEQTYELTLFSIPDEAKIIDDRTSPQTQRFNRSLSSAPSDGLNYLVVWVRDISAQKQREKLQRDIISTTSHDLKGPLSSILLSAELLADKRTAQEKMELLLNRMVSSAQGALQMVDELLSARIIREGVYEIRPQLINVVEVAQTLIEQFEMRAAAKGVSIRLELTKKQERLDWSLDLVAFQRIVANLISNAVKFTSQRGEIKVVLYSCDDHLILQVSDTGSGMDRHEARNLFERFSRLESHHEIEGTGLGLFIVKSLTQALGGSIEVSSEKGKGTSFRIKLPHLLPLDQIKMSLSQDEIVVPTRARIRD